MPLLQGLTLGWSRIGDSGAAAIGKLTHLNRLFLGIYFSIIVANFKENTPEGGHFTDIGCKSIAKLTNLKKLYINKMSISNAGLANFTSISGLNILNINDNKNITDDGIIPLIANMKAVNELYANEAVLTDKAAVEIGAKWKALSVFHVLNSAFTDTGLVAIATGCTRLSTLVINSDQITETG